MFHNCGSDDAKGNQTKISTLLRTKWRICVILYESIIPLLKANRNYVKKFVLIAFYFWLSLFLKTQYILYCMHLCFFKAFWGIAKDLIYFVLEVRMFWLFIQLLKLCKSLYFINYLYAIIIFTAWEPKTQNKNLKQNSWKSIEYNEFRKLLVTWQ